MTTAVNSKLAGPHFLFSLSSMIISNLTEISQENNGSEPTCSWLRAALVMWESKPI